MEYKEKSLDKLNNLVGIEGIKIQFEQYLATMRSCREKGMVFHGHMVFMGNPGTAKTTVARLFADILHEEGLLPKGHIIAVTPLDLVGEYIGQTGAKTQAVCNSAKGGTLFIDEAYGLMESYGEGYNYKREAIEVLLGFMTSVEADDTIVILSGYKEEMERLIKANHDLKSRIPWVFVFEDYTNDELTKFFQVRLAAERMVIGEEALACARDYLASLPRNKGFGNAREVDMLVSVVKTNQSRRIHEITNPTEEDLFTILPQDIPTIEHNNIPCEETGSNKRNPKEIKNEIVQIVNELQFGFQKLQSKLNELCDD
jgi:SpoVK/Ycf46/Vps4 family AAA+-type ATPase